MVSRYQTLKDALRTAFSETKWGRGTQNSNKIILRPLGSKILIILV